MPAPSDFLGAGPAAGAALPAAANAAASDGDVAVVVPTLRPGGGLARLIGVLREQARPPAEIIIIDSSSGDGTAENARAMGCRAEVVRRESFDHGGTRHLGVSMTTGRFIVFLTQDALPRDSHFLTALTAPLQRGCAAVYARQIPYPSATPLERFHRGFNYPEQSHVRDAADLARMGLRAAFFSNVASAVERAAYEAVGGFPTGVILNEDTMLAYRLLRAGHRVAYAADAEVYHSHTYGVAQQFRRYFDIGASHAQGDGGLAGLPVAREGSRFARQEVRALAREGAWLWLPRAGVELAAKWLAFQLGRRALQLPVAVTSRLSLQPAYWRRRFVSKRLPLLNASPDPPSVGSGVPAAATTARVYPPTQAADSANSPKTGERPG